MMEDMVKVKYLIGKRRYKWIYVKESEVEAVKEANRMIWREEKKKKREYELQERLGIKICSLQGLEEDGEEFASDFADPLDKIIQNEDREEKAKVIGRLLKSLSPRQRKMVEMVYFENKSQDEIAEEFNVSKSAISHAMSKIYSELQNKLNYF